MRNKLKKPLCTFRYSTWNEFIPCPGSVYIYGTSVEERSVHPNEWENGIEKVNFVRIWASDDACETEFSQCHVEDEEKKVFSLRSSDQLSRYISSMSSKCVYIDITGLSHSIWAPLLRASINTSKLIFAVYVEPQTYSFSRTPTEAEIFDLSEQIHGIRPLPGFSLFEEPINEDAVVFIPLLGFEGRRLAHVLEIVQPPSRTIIPIVGVPGFRAEYPFHTYLGNRNVLQANNMHTRVRFAIANSASDVFYLLHDIAGQYPDHLLKIAPIGTKPHALGAILFALMAERPVEVIYDHPIRKAKRTTGNANVLIYNIRCIIDSCELNH